jgi:glycosyltransferase involved in cell wall biosynthesis
MNLSVIIPTFNSASYLRRTLTALALQEYPADEMEVLITDGGSIDGTLSIAAEFKGRLKLQIFDNSAHREAEYGKALALAHARGRLVQFMDADMWPATSSLLSRLARPLLEDASLAGAIASYRYSHELDLWNRFLSCDELQRDPLLQALTPALSDFVVERPSATLQICEFPTERIPPIGGTTMFRHDDIAIGRWGDHFREVDHPVTLIKRGKRRFAHILADGWLHEHCNGLKDLVRKRTRNLSGLQTSFLAVDTDRDFMWIDRTNRREVLRLARWVIGTNLLIPRAAEGVAQALRLRRWEPLLRPIAAIAVTDGLLLALLRNNAGRGWLKSILR